MIKPATATSVCVPLLLLLGSVPAWGRQVSAGSAAQAVQTSSQPVLAAGDAARLAKIQPIIECLNVVFPHYEQLSLAYDALITASADPKKRNTALEAIEFSVQPYERDGALTRRCAKGLADVVTLPPADPTIDKFALDASAALLELLPPGRAMDAYLKRKTYLEDGFSKGRTLDATISPLLERIMLDDIELRSAVDREQLSLGESRLAALDKAAGHNLTWHTERSMLAARALGERVTELALQDSLDPEAVSAAAKPLEAALDEAESFLSAHPDASQPNASHLQPMWFAVSSSLNNELGAANELRHALKDTSLSAIDLQVQVHNAAARVRGFCAGAISIYNVMRENHTTVD